MREGGEGEGVGLCSCDVRARKERGFLWSLMEQFLLVLDGIPGEGV